jgi:hypothetical protein
VADIGLRDSTSVRSRIQSLVNDLFPGLLVLFFGFLFAILINSVNDVFSNRPEKVVAMLMVVFVILLVIPALTYLVITRRLADPPTTVLIVLLSATFLLVSIYFFWVSSAVRYPADILTWSEGDFVNDILKFRIGYPIYTAQVNNESFPYVPGPRLLTYFIASLSGNSTSIPVYRIIQLGYAVLAAMVAFLCVRVILRMISSSGQIARWRIWSAAGLPFLFLVATNSLTNPFVHTLHDDSLAQLYSVLAYFLLLTYISKRSKRLLILMAVFPAVGFLIKQSLVVWAVFYCVHVAFFDRPFSFKRLSVFAASSFASIGVVISGCYLIWGDPFIYWVFTVLGSHSVSFLRSFQHMLDVWIYYVIGLGGGLVLLRGKNIQKLLSPWLIWLSLMLLETYTSGIAWMINHIGPASLIASIWFVTGLIIIWPELSRLNKESRRQYSWLRAGLVLGVMGFLFSGLGVVRIPLPALPKDAYRYLHEIEQQFGGQPAKDILLDSGSWVYVKEKVIMKDRAPCIGERGYSGTGDFSGIIQRLEQKRYKKILVRDLHSPEFFYDYWLWRKSSGIRKTLLENYHEVGLIKGVDGLKNPFFSNISILVPNSP